MNDKKELERIAWELEDEPRPGEHQAYVYHVVLADDPSAQRDMHKDGFPTLHRFTEEPCK